MFISFYKNLETNFFVKCKILIRKTLKIDIKSMVGALNQSNYNLMILNQLQDCQITRL